MPVLDTTDKITPKSVLRYRPMGERVAPARKRSIVTTATLPVVPRASRAYYHADVSEDTEEWLRDETEEGISEGSKRYTSRPPVTGASAARPKRKVKRKIHPVLYLSSGMLAMLMLGTIGSAVFGWFNTTLDDLRFGRPRTFQTDAWVGHNEQNGTPSHFIAINLNRHIEIIELPGGDAAHAHIYVGPQLYAQDDDLVPVTLSFADVNGDHKPDMIATYQGTRAVFINTGDGYRPLSEAERPQVEQFLQHLGR
ncbi:VCBS repeat-containing protein [Ktedonosporobacter rubrisoli]|uniref:VCBS repeat-containing protein n=1 Tax=Ktedonosporobacter rubrisoli TaxID=2509675 RepID=A0A4P6JQN4_KTERU|nr:VCBS repeat-containing protein [Ktedonosporobacter rubrisoli]QBD77739.1 VCBS repeat-containing protein [Ktedonosporobacter rubrisoli]